MIQVRLEEDDDNAYRVEADGLRWVDMVRVGVAGGISGGGSWEIPIEVRTDPKRVQGGLASFDLELVSEAGAALSVSSLTLPASGGKWVLETVADPSPTEVGS